MEYWEQVQYALAWLVLIGLVFAQCSKPCQFYLMHQSVLWVKFPCRARIQRPQKYKLREIASCILIFFGNVWFCCLGCLAILTTGILARIVRKFREKISGIYSWVRPPRSKISNFFLTPPDLIRTPPPFTKFFDFQISIYFVYCSFTESECESFQFTEAQSVFSLDSPPRDLIRIPPVFIKFANFQISISFFPG